MADSTKSNIEVYYLRFLAPALIAVIAGLVIQSFIIVVNISNWAKGSLMTPLDHIVTSLGVSRLFLPCAQALYLLIFCLSLKNLYLYVNVIFIDEVYSFFIYLDIWLTSLLSIVLCLKIANLHTGLFLYLKKIMVQRTGYFIVASVFFSIFNCLFSLLTDLTEWIKGETRNTTISDLLIYCPEITVMSSFAISTFIPVPFYCLSMVLFFTSLYHHISKIKMCSNLTINLETYYSAMKFASFTFTYNTTYLFGHFLCMFYQYFYCVDLVQLYVTLSFLPVLHSCLLIYRTAKLRSQMTKVLQSVTDFLFQRKYTETRENIEIIAQ